MFTSRLVVLSMAIVVGAGSAAAQSSADNNSASLLQQFKAPADSSPTIRVDQFRLPLNGLAEADSNRPGLSFLPGEQVERAAGPGGHVSKHELEQMLDQRQAKTCYAIRSYRVKRDDPGSDATTPAGYSTCQPTTRFQVKSAVEALDPTDR